MDENKPSKVTTGFGISLGYDQKVEKRGPVLM